jgi:copper homeostasis protein CutC
MAKTLEVIVTTVDEAIEAEAGGADRLELVRALDVGGLTPEISIARGVLAAVRIPVRVMVREEAHLHRGGGLYRALHARTAKRTRHTAGHNGSGESSLS